MSEPKIVAYVCNWCTYLGADLAGTNRLEYPPNVRLIRLPCTGRIDFNLIVKAFEIGADAILVSGCHPGDCHYTAGNYHARRRWMLFRPLLDTLGFDLRRIHFSWISAAEGRKFQQVISEITESARALGPADYLTRREAAPVVPRTAPAPVPPVVDEAGLRANAAGLLRSGEAQVVIGYDAAGTPMFLRREEDCSRLAVNENARVNLAGYLTRPEVRSMGRPAVVALPSTTRAINVLEQECQVDRSALVEIAVEKPSAGAPWKELEDFLKLAPEQRMAYWMEEFERCTRCYACRAACPMCYCQRCVADKNRPQTIDTSATLKGNFAWHITRAFHQAGRCTGCGECTRACPAGINLGLLNKAVAKAASDNFGYQAGAGGGAGPLLGTYRPDDKEAFIR